MMGEKAGRRNSAGARRSPLPSGEGKEQVPRIRWRDHRHAATLRKTMRSGRTHRKMPGKEGARAAPGLECRDVVRSFGGLKALKGVSLRVEPGQIFGLVGPNGSGKTTLINAITGFYPPQEGRILYDGGDITGVKPHRAARLGIARTFQNLALFRGMSVLDNILMGRHIHMR